VQAIQAAGPAQRGEAELVQGIWGGLAEQGFDVDLEAVASLYLATRCGPVVNIAGPPGTGKSTLARSFCRSLGASTARGTLVEIAVQAGWRGPQDLLAARPVGGEQGDTLARILVRSASRTEQLHFVILDDWNLSPVELYLSPILRSLTPGCTLSLPAESGERWIEVELARGPDHHRHFVLGTASAGVHAHRLGRRLLDLSASVVLQNHAPAAELATPEAAAEPPPLPALTAESWIAMALAPTTIATPEPIHALWRALAGPHGADHRQAFGPRLARLLGLGLHHGALLQAALGLDTGAGWALDLQLRQRILPHLLTRDTPPRVLQRLLLFCQERELTRAATQLSASMES